MADVADFAEDGFDPIAWINNACVNKPSEEPLEKFLAELEMRLQLSAEDIEATLGENSAQAMRRIPFAIQEIYRLQGDIQGMQDQVQVMAQTVQRDASEARHSVEHISALHLVKGNMENACNSLKEATELSGLFVKVEEVFAAGDLPKVAEILASMRRSLSLVGDVPEFRAGRQKLRALEDRLQTQVEGSLGEALAKGQDDDNTRKLCGLLLAVDRYSTIESLYVSTKMAQVHALWEDCAAKGAAAAAPGAAPAEGGAALWLPTFLARLLGLLEAEAAWGAHVLPGHAATLQGALCLAVFTKISKGVRDRLAPVRAIGPLAALARELGAFGRGLLELLREVEAGRRKDIIGLVFAPLEDKVAAYGELEAAQLAADLRAALPPQGGPAGGEDAEGAVARLAGSIRPAFAALHAAVERCTALTGGSEVRALLRAVDAEAAAYLGAMAAGVQGLGARHKAAAAAAGGAGGGAEDGEDIANVLQLIKVGRELSAAVGRLEAALRTAVASAVARLSALVAPSTSPFAPPGGASAPSAAPSTLAPGPSLAPGAEADPVALRLVAHRGEKLGRLSKLGASLSDPRFQLLPAALAQLDSFGSTVQSTVFDVLLARVAALLAPLPSLPDWRKGAPGEGGSSFAAAPLPSFNTYPLPYVTAIGDHLMAMPQQLEVLMGDAADEGAAAAGGGGGEGGGSGAGAAAEWEELAAEWLDKAVTGAASMYADSIFKIPDLGPQGGCQLSTDVEYFVNVMGALHVAPPPSLLTVQLLAGAAPEEFADLARGALAEGGADSAALKALAGMRRLPLEPPQPQQ
ncbi:hypothetical protein HYH03_012002 [Edaphochlamys debaryana]|uniref:Conserved oligomeric Golgi complex subunit 7 n=1 Tax=Edaphochlamys debaryana TaxID=47281 RepID=A0A836BUG6_9CHLO|nr:hypothetical protein HYH03_012002 [Edaphochlamys debaryana]|eukprot:KAG2489551.1 hypothetical protein HYH03_012002 [Edaphochlamys debaryana]